MALRISSDLQRYKEENESLQLENKYLRDSKLALIKSTAREIERLRQFITLLSNALRGQGISVRNIHQINNIAPNKINKSFPKKKEWKYKQKRKQQQTQNNNIKSNWYSTDSISNVATKSSSTLNSLIDEKEEKQQPMSLKERMNALQNTTKNNGRVSQKIDALKAERNLKSVKVTTASRDNIASLFAEKIEKQKKTASATSMNSAKGKMLKEALKNPEPERSAEIVESLGLFVVGEKPPNFKKKEKETEREETSSLEALNVLNMNNNVMMKKMTDSEKDNMENLICDSIINHIDLEQVQMCNADINDDFLIKILNKLSNNNHNVKELWFESNPIGDKGMKALANFIQNDDKITIIKLYNNKKTISTQILNDLIDGLSQNTTIVKFVFDGFRFQHQKDRKEKYLRRNTEIARKKRNEERKQLKAL